MNGKSKCKILKDIRRQIAEQNDIAYVTSECKFQGNCSGTCPKCESEVRYLEEELRKRQRAGKAIAVAGIAAAMLITAAGCSTDTSEPTSSIRESYSFSDSLLLGVIPDPDSAPSEDTWMGEMLPAE